MKLFTQKFISKYSTFVRKLTLLGGGRYLPIDSPDSIGSLFLSLEYPLLIVWYSEAGISACHEKTKTKFVNEMLFGYYDVYYDSSIFFVKAINC